MIINNKQYLLLSFYILKRTKRTKRKRKYHYPSLQLWLGRDEYEKVYGGASNLYWFQNHKDTNTRVYYDRIARDARAWIARIACEPDLKKKLNANWSWSKKELNANLIPRKELNAKLILKELNVKTYFEGNKRENWFWRNCINKRTSFK